QSLKLSLRFQPILMIPNVRQPKMPGELPVWT
ncbi:MAG: hypothetical protein ACI9US_002983, partial [Gammaproteobacteria bacterium]